MEGAKGVESRQEAKRPRDQETKRERKSDEG